VTQSRVRAIPEGMNTITPHIVVRDAARAAEWYIEALGAEERSRIPVPGDKLMSVELRIGDSAVMVADEFPEMGVLSPQSVGGTSTVLNLYVEDVDALWERVVEAGAEVLHPLGDTFWGDRHGQITDPLVTAGLSPSTCATSRQRRLPASQPRRSAVKPLEPVWGGHHVPEAGWRTCARGRVMGWLPSVKKRS
jgi:PhnB protein